MSNLTDRELAQLAKRNLAAVAIINAAANVWGEQEAVEALRAELERGAEQLADHLQAGDQVSQGITEALPLLDLHQLLGERISRRRQA